MSDSKEHVKYRVFAYIGTLHINKNINFQTKVTWKRNVNKTQTSTVTHQEGLSLFDETLQLELNLVYNPQQAKFQPKMTEFGVVVVYHGKIKSGGSVKFDAADVVNLDYQNKSIQLKLIQCPDPCAFIEVTFNYQVTGQSSRSLFNELSMLNGSTIEKDLSQIDFQEEQPQETPVTQSQERETLKQSNEHNLPFKEKELHKINNILDKFQTLSRRVSKSAKEEYQQQKNQSMDLSTIPSEHEEKLRYRVSQLEARVEELENTVQTFQKQTQELANKLRNRDCLIEEGEERLERKQREIDQLQLRLQLISREKEEVLQNDKHIASALVQSQNKFKVLYQKTLNQLQEMRGETGEGNFSKQSMKFAKFQEQVNEINQIAEFGQESTEWLYRQNIQLQTKIASISHNIAQLFNAAYEYGGAQLLDYLQSSIGLVEN